jgi:hypothetical protein
MSKCSSHTSARPAVWTVVAGAMILLAFVLALRATAGLEWPCEDDFFRDMGGAQAILDGYAGSDPAYLGETNWFNPLQPSLFAALAALTGLPLHIAYARFGPFVNLSGPIGFYLLASQLLGRRAGLAALLAYLFLGNPAVPSWFQATYSPWAWPMDFAQGFFYLTLAAYARALATQRLRWDVITGVLLGITFLAHTAPTLVFVGMLFLLTLFSRRGDRPSAVRRLFVVGVVSLLVASPYLGPLLVNYKLHVLNHGPSEYEPIGVGFVPRNLLSLRAAVAGLGLVVVLIYRSTTPARTDVIEERKHDGQRAGVLTAVLASSALLLGYGLLAQGLAHREIANLPRVLPTYHFHLYVKAAESLLFGVGVAAAARFVAARWPTSETRARYIERWLFAGLLAAVFAVHFPGYLGGVELNKFRQESERIAADADRIALYGWLLNDTKPTDVFLADMHVGMWAVSAADRKVVCLNDQYSNIYVSYAERAGDLDRLYASLRAGDHSAFDALAAKYRVTHVILAKKTPQSCSVPPDSMAPDRFTLVFEKSDYRVYSRK